MQLIESHKVPALEKSIRLQDYGIGIFSTNLTKSGLKKAIKKGLVFVDGKIATTALYIIGNETIEFFQSEENRKEFDFDLKVLFEDDILAVIYKPAGILVSGNSFATIDNALFQNIKKSTQTDAVKPRPVHRLDYPTSGLLLIGKTNSSIIALNKLFENKEIQKTYHAVSIGKMESQGTIKLPIDDKKSLTHFKVLKTVTSERFGFLNLVKLSPKTGRKHQLRKHLASLGNPILGDKEYYLDNLILNGKGLYLHASTLEFVHPFTKENICVSENLPKKFKKIFPH
ncbi:RluA family pseudouridine synthase [Tenacibaculum aquimarinum]|uniref:RluA family pseudouridine synthase n=1 Tax=Tenacibaculum aquimarinum TaxID=2910675 RepID=UPI001F0A1524|nr:RluA family pseudouridine synthase [Tenacibaculum aquimarinum]MCH3884786.1 RluA family pseudouridine synthase [Tenacibaculum aquimarinum]